MSSSSFFDSSIISTTNNSSDDMSSTDFTSSFVSSSTEPDSIDYLEADAGVSTTRRNVWKLKLGRLLHILVCVLFLVDLFVIGIIVGLVVMYSVSQNGEDTPVMTSNGEVYDIRGECYCCSSNDDEKTTRKAAGVVAAICTPYGPFVVAGAVLWFYSMSAVQKTASDRCKSLCGYGYWPKVVNVEAERVTSKNSDDYKIYDCVGWCKSKSGSQSWNGYCNIQKCGSTQIQTSYNPENEFYKIELNPFCLGKVQYPDGENHLMPCEGDLYSVECRDKYGNLFRN